MSKRMMMTSNCKPPLGRSPIRLRSRRVLEPTSYNEQTPQDSLIKSQKLKRAMDVEGCDLRPIYQTISCELRNLARMVQKEFGNENAENVNLFNSFDANSSPLFQRGRFYEVYTARRNERLKRKKKRVSSEEKQPIYDLGVRVESVKRKAEVKKGISRTVPSPPMTERRESSSSRYFLRSVTNKDNKKPPLATPFSGTQRKTATKSIRKI